jgi:hypothetical protein
MSEETVIVVGAGPAGLAVAYHLQMQGIPYRILEKGTIGWSWQHHYESLKLNSIKSLATLPGMPMPSAYPIYPSRSEFLAYLQAYAHHFSLKVEGEVEVLKVVSAGDHWLLETNRGAVNTRTLVMATGVWSNPFAPKFRDSENFKGRLLHVRDYRNSKEFAGHRVLIIGAGSSAVDVALDLARHGVQVGLSVRSGINLVPRVSSALVVNLAAFLLKTRITRAVMEPILLRLRPNFSALGLPPHPASINDLRYHPVVGYEIVEAVREGKVKIYPSIERFNEHSVQFNDGRSVEFDVAIMATGYRPSLKLVEDYVHLDAEGYPILDGCRSTLNPALYCVGFSHSITVTEGWLRTIGQVAGEAVSQIASGLPQGDSKGVSISGNLTKPISVLD